MTAKLSAGVLLFRIDPNDVVEVLIAHMGGPFWVKKDKGGWSIPKGEYVDGEDPLTVACREFHEELGQPVPATNFVDLGEVKQPSGKRLHVWAAEGSLDVSSVVSNTFKMEWPKGSDNIQEFPEIDKAEWFPVRLARKKLLKGHLAFLNRLLEHLRAYRPSVNEGLEETRNRTLLDV
jgi:predicted NUDIX family NTP pyrophosphohydrolase